MCIGSGSRTRYSSRRISVGFRFRKTKSLEIIKFKIENTKHHETNSKAEQHSEEVIKCYDERTDVNDMIWMNTILADYIRANIIIYFERLFENKPLAASMSSVRPCEGEGLNRRGT